jgi:hypothetical protein
MEYLSAVAGVIILLVLGVGAVGVAYLAWDDIRSFKFSFGSPGSLSLASVTTRLNAVPTSVKIMSGAVVVAAALVYLLISNGLPVDSSDAVQPASEARAADAKAAVATPAAPVPVSVVRTVTSASCATDGCPVSCASEEVLATAYCVTGKTARLTDLLQVKAGVVTAKCGPTASGIVVSCAHK